MSEPSSTATGSDADSQSPGGSTLAVISRRVVGLLKEYYGKGPTSARTYHFGDLVVVLLKGGHTTAERTLIDSGRQQIVSEQRNAFQEAMGPRFKQVVEEELRREVIAFMSCTHNDPDLHVELFVLASEGRAADEPVLEAGLRDAAVDAAG